MKPWMGTGMVLCLLALNPALAQEAEPMSEAEQLEVWQQFLGSIDWVGPGDTGKMGRQAQFEVPEGYVFTGKKGTQSLMEAYGNLLSNQEMGFVAPARAEGQPDFEWFAVFEFDKVGYVKDDDKEELDAEAMMESMLENEEIANEQRREMGYDTLHITGWAMPPQYNEQTNNLEWAIGLRSGDGGEVLNLNTRLLGRDGVMKVTLVCDPHNLEATIPVYQGMLEDFSFQDGRRYAEFKQGDKIAKYGLTGLVVGGGAAVLAKTGLLKRLLKPILIGLLAVGAFFKKLFGGRQEE